MILILHINKVLLNVATLEMEAVHYIYITKITNVIFSPVFEVTKILNIKLRHKGLKGYFAISSRHLAPLMQIYCVPLEMLIWYWRDKLFSRDHI